MTVEAYIDEVLAIWSETGRRTTCTISGHSMEPLVRAGDTLVVRHGSGDVRIGDVVLFKVGERLVAHRIVALRSSPSGDEVFVAKGDASPALDETLPRGRILGVVEEVRGTRGRLLLRGRYWRLAGRLLAVHSYASTVEARRSSLLWRLAGVPHRVRKMIPWGGSLRGALVAVMRGMARLLPWSPRGSESPTGGPP